MKSPISLGKIKLKYFLMIGFAIGFLFLGRRYTLYSDEKKKIFQKYLTEEDKGREGVNYTDNKLLKTFLKYIGFALFIIGDLIIKKLSFGRIIGTSITEVKSIVSKKYNLTKEDSRVIMTYKDWIFIFIIALLHIADEIIAIIIKTIKGSKNIAINEAYISIEFIFLFLTSYLIFKLKYYKHQYITIIIIIFLEIFRLFILGNDDENFSEFITTTLLQIIRAFIDSLFIGYSKGLMEYKYFSPYKALYIFGFINGTIITILYVIATIKPVDPSSIFCTLKYEGKCYFDNFKSIFKDFSFVQFLGLFFNMISSSTTQLLFNAIINDFTICHIFIYYTFYSFYDIFNKQEGEKNHSIIQIIFATISGIFEFIAAFVFLEIIVLNFCGLDKNVKINIEERAIRESLFEKEERNESFDLVEDYDVEVKDIKKKENNSNPLKVTQLSPINDNEEEQEKEE